MGVVLVAGATGYLGRHAVAAFRARGHCVRALVRQEGRSGTDETVVAGATSEAALDGVCHGTDWVLSALGSRGSEVAGSAIARSTTARISRC